MFKKWCSEQGFTGGSGSPTTHVLMDGGVLSVPFDRLDEFYRGCIQCVKAGEKIYVVEQKTDVYNFFMDVDYKADEALELEDVKSLAVDICFKINSLGLPKRCVISVAAPKRKDNQIKTGIHFNWPDIQVNQEGAITLMYHVVSSLNTLRSGDWSKYIDKSVYGDMDSETKGSGFRMPWSHKMGKHADCHGHGCLVCNKTGKLIEGEYLPAFMYTEDGDLDKYPYEVSMDGLNLTTIRSLSTEPMDVPKFAGVVKKPRKEGTFTASQTKDEVCNIELYGHLETFIQKYMTGQQRARVKRVFRNKKGYMLDTTSKYCENLGRAHHSNHIWFLISCDGTIRQKCFCRCETMDGRKYGFCKDFDGRAHYLNKTITDILYPDGVTTKKKRVLKR